MLHASSFPLRGPAVRLAQQLALAVLAAGGALADTVFVPGPTQYIAALGDKAAKAGTDAGSWGFWAVDPGPRGVWVKDYPALMANGGVAPDGWQFRPEGWWLEEHGLMMEGPSFDLPAGRYVVTGGREVTAVLTVGEADAEGRQDWALSDGASVYDVTHLGCRAAIYTPLEGQECLPEKTPLQVFPMSPEVKMPDVEGCRKVDYQVLIVVGMMVEG